MIIEIYKDGKLYECKLNHEDIGMYNIISKSKNVKDIDFGLKENEYGFTETIEIYLE